MLYVLYALVYILGTFVGLAFVFRKAGIAPWKALVPVYNIVVWIKMCGKSRWWYLYFLIPAINIFTFLLLIVETAKLFRRNSLWEQTLAVIFPWAYMLWLGCSKKQSFTPASELPKIKNSSAREWAEAIIFALVAAVIIRNNVFEFYNIPSSSMEKSLMTGDYLMVSKISYGPRVNMVPLSLPLMHNVVPLTDGQVESYLRWPSLPYYRFPGITHVQRYDATVFNYPDGDTVCSAFQSNRSYHDLVRQYGRDRVLSDREHFGKIVVRPMSKKENFIKRTIGLPGETIEIRDRVAHINGSPIEDPANLQFTYAIRMATDMSAYLQQMASMGGNIMQLEQQKLQADYKYFASNYSVSSDDWNSATYYLYLPLTDDMIAQLQPYDNLFSFEVLGAAPNNPDAHLVQLAPDYGVASNEMEFQQRDMEIHNAYLQLTSTFKSMGLTDADIEQANQYYTLPLTASEVQRMMSDPSVAQVVPIVSQRGYGSQRLFPHAAGYDWTVDNFGPVLIPAKGMTLDLTLDNLPLYRRAIETFERNKVEVRDGQIYINGEPTTTYTFKMDYYWLMGDNRHNSADSRYWGFVPEDHISGKATRVIASKDKDCLDGHRFRWNRVFRKASRID